MANEHESLIESIATENGIFSEQMIERAKDDLVVAALLRCAQNLKTIANNATFKLAEDLNSVDTHFVLECIQNAADNQYTPEVEPFLRIRARPDRIQLDCNEKGFTPADVKAICKVGGSNKTSKKGFIGAKGIGFKSVFKIAQEVYIYSPPYSFRFDKGQELGMIIPIWVPEEEVLVDSAKDCQTSILLLPPAAVDFTNHLDEFKAISPTLLLFLPKLKRLEILIHEKQSDGGELLTRRDLRSKINKTDKVITLTVDDTSFPHPKVYNYRKFTGRWQALKGEEQREGVKTSEVILAFPIDNVEGTRLATQDVHAFLPIRDFGFTFVIQADFIVTANRQDVNKSKDWNVYQRNCIAHTFKDAILEFVLLPDEPLRYTWMRFLPPGPQNLSSTNQAHLRPRVMSDPFWNLAAKKIWELIQESKVIESRAKLLHLPHTLERLANIIVDRDGEPLVGSPSEYLAARYDKQDFQILEELGVQAPSWASFLTRLCNMTDSELKSKCQSWHEDLAKALHSIEQKPDWKTFSSKVKSKALIPLLNGNDWIPATGLESNPVYFREGAGRIKVPSDISPRFVEESASDNLYRKKLFKLLGVREYDQSEVASAILRKHGGGSGLSAVTEAEAVAHTLYLFDLDSSITDKVGLSVLWLFDEQGVAAKGQDLYVRDTSAYGPAALFEGHTTSARFLSSKYAKLQDSKSNGHRFLQWLMKRTGLTDVPRLHRSGILTPEFKFILQKYPDKVLDILKTFWWQYKDGMAHTAIREAIRNHPTACFDGQTRMYIPLKDCYVPDSRLKERSSELCGPLAGAPFISIEPYKVSEWDFLSTFGVGLEPDLSFYLWIAGQSQFRRNCTIESAKSLLKYIASLTGFDESKQIQVRSAFKSQNLLPALSPFSSNFTDLAFTFPSLCVWKAPKGFRKEACLELLYGQDPSITSLVKTTLQVEDTSVADVLDDLTSGYPSDSYLEESLHYIATKLPLKQGHGGVQCVRDAFKIKPLITVPLSSLSGSTRVFPGACVWGGPQLTHKWNLQPHYENDAELRVLLCSHLDIKSPSLDDLMMELVLLKTNPATAVGQIEQIYSYISEKFSGAGIRARFESDALVCIEGVDGVKLWKRPSDCVWTAPDFLRCKIPIANRHGFREASAISLLQNTLSIRNASLTDFIEDLRILRDTGEMNPDIMEILYKSIELSIFGHESEVKKTFNEENLVYSHQLQPPQWIKLGACIWSGPVGLQTTTKLSRCYPSLSTLFTKYLRVQNATPETVLDELRSVVGDFQQPGLLPKNLARRVTDLLLTFKSSTLSPSILQALRRETIWPCKVWQNDLSTVFTLTPITGMFFIPDHEYLLELFDGKLRILELTSAEVIALKPLFVKLEVKDKFLSNSVREIASANDTSMPAEDLSQELRERAQALFSCAEHFSKHDQVYPSRGKLYKLLRGIQVFQASDISTTYTINAQGIQQTVKTTGLMRLDEEEDQLRLFVPRDENGQKDAFAICLAKEMIRFLGLPEAESWRIITAVLTIEPQRLDSFLHRQGIMNHPNTAPSHSDLTKEDEVSSDVETTMLDERFGALTLSFHESNSRDDEVSADTLPTLVPIVKIGSANTMRDIDHKPITNGTSSPGSLRTTHGSNLAIPEQESELQSRASLQNSDGPRTPTPNRNIEQDFSLRAENVIRKARNCKPESFSLVSSQPRGSRSSVTSEDTETSTTSSDSDSASYSSATTSSFEEGDILNTLSKGITKTTNNRHIKSTVSENRQPISSPSSGKKRNNHSSPPRAVHRGPDSEVGFLGEQYIVKVLKQRIDDFDENVHWTSKLRRYANIPSYNNAEVTDLEYQDRNGYLSRLLRSWTNGDVPDWLEQACIRGNTTWPKYWLEVKTTTGSCETPFFITTHQHQLMKEMAILDNGMPKNVYVLLRVFNIEGEEAGVRGYIDPWSERKRGNLKFETHYTVTPCRELRIRL